MGFNDLYIKIMSNVTKASKTSGPNIEKYLKSFH